MIPTPTGNKVIVKRMPESDKTDGGIILLTHFREKADSSDTAQDVIRGEVLAVGPGRKTKKGKTVPMEIKPGDKILYTEFAHIKIVLDGEQYAMLKESDIIGLVEA